MKLNGFLFESHLVSCRPAFGGNDCGGRGIEAELCHQQVHFHGLLMVDFYTVTDQRCLLSGSSCVCRPGAVQVLHRVINTSGTIICVNGTGC